MPIKQPPGGHKIAQERPTPERFLAGFPNNMQALADRLRQLIKQTIPSTTEAVYPGWKLIGYREQDGQRSRYFCYIAPFADRVVLGFEWGVLMADTGGLLEGDGKQVRYVTLRDAADLRPRELSALIAEAAMVAATRARLSTNGSPKTARQKGGAGLDSS